MKDVDPVPTLSVVVALISGKTDDLASCLRALRDQESPPALEILIPYDDPCKNVTCLAETYPEVRFIRAEGLDSASSRAGAVSEHHDTLRTIGLKSARGRYVALTEDHATLAPNWCRTLIAMLEEHPELAAIGGAVECGSSRLLNRAVYYCDFGRYQNPVPEGPARFVSDANVVYRREALDEIRGDWGGDYHEYSVHQLFVARGRPIWLTPRTVAWQNRGELTILEALRERYVWGRSFAGIRVAGVPFGKRLAFACVCPVLPVILTLRLTQRAFAHRQRLAEFLVVLPLVAVLTTAWAYGEFVGYLTGQPSSESVVVRSAVLG